ncbi:quinone-dependent dihydroorotate dehydrogenase [Thorsellia anophelis]|uniref:Dihydroorotate dehydrogenase (quinone) n=1 Tax=Thorsellia anophelis DSM 18579 TaxID=1123402 RepID=A0A1I0CSR8_9GAMM|nr:quinone-dependent dihydroorotate dehydrogenase [Thorsellia anophelis]SET22633.1 dihydroorotate oxidase A [Thorsellia anophelis DSM 18579]
MFYPLLRKILFTQDAEKVHEYTLKGLSHIQRLPILPYFYSPIRELPKKPITCMGITFPNPIGLAAGLDKNGECIQAFAAMGFGSIEIGTVTPRAQEGNPKPRLFRVRPAEGIINRMGFNNHGIDNLIENVKISDFKGVLGINIGKNKDTPVENGKDDYLHCLKKAYVHASYITVNISSPNTPDLRTLQYGDALDDLLSALKLEQASLVNEHKKYVPIAVKIAPDLSLDEIHQIADSLVRHQIDGVIATNTTLDRSLIQGLEHSTEQGGLSGRPVQLSSTEVIRTLNKALSGKLPIIGVGGIDSLVSAREKLQAGASVLQLYSGFIYKGPKLVRELVKSI